MKVNHQSNIDMGHPLFTVRNLQREKMARFYQLFHDDPNAIKKMRSAR